MNVKIVKAEESLTIERLQEAEKVIGEPLPDEYRNFLLKYNGGHPKPSCFRIKWGGQEWVREGWDIGMMGYFLAIYDGEASNFLDYYETFQGRIPEDTIPIANDPCGNLILLGIKGKNRGKVFFWIHDLMADVDETDPKNLGFVANSFNEFIESLFEAE